MLENFHLAAILRQGTHTYLRQIRLHQNLQGTLAESWEGQFLQFTTGIEEVDFDPGYRPERHERFRLSDYMPPEWLAKETSQTIQHLGLLDSETRLLDSITGIVGMARDGKGRN